MSPIKRKPAAFIFAVLAGFITAFVLSQPTTVNASAGTTTLQGQSVTTTEPGEWVCWHHQNPNNPKKSWDEWITEEDLHQRHDDHPGDYQNESASLCGPSPVSPVVTSTPLPLPEIGCGQYRVENLSTDIVEIHPGESLIVLGINRTFYALDIPPNQAAKGQVFATGPEGNKNAWWLTIMTWNERNGWKAWQTFRSPQCRPQNDLVFTVTSSGVQVDQPGGWEVKTAGPITYQYK